MRISRLPRDHAHATLTRRALEAFVLGLAFAFLPELFRSTDAALDPHPAWIAVVVLAARDGIGGFFAGLTAAAACVGVGSAIGGADLATSWNRLDSGHNLAAFGACLAVSWIGSWHLGRQVDLGKRLHSLSERAAEGDATIDGLRNAVSALRARVDRTSSSLSFLRDVAARLEGGDRIAAAEGAADLVLARTGAAAVAVKVGRNGFQRLLAIRDARGPSALSPLALRDADLTVPVRNGNGQFGIIAVWGIPPAGLDEAMTHDLEVVASWCAPAFSEAWRLRRPEDGSRRLR